MQAEDIRRLKEDFVSNLHGTTKWEIFCVVSCLPLCLLIAAYAEAWVHARSRASGKALLKLQRIPKFCYEFAIVVVPQLLLLMSVAPAEAAFLLLFLLWGSLALKLWMKLAHSPGSRQHMLHLLNHISAPRKRYVSVFRGGLMLITCLSILAVDFQAFPRRYAKAESFGAGVMDVGVGAIVWAGGLVSAAAAAAAAVADVGLDSSMQAVPGSSSKDSSRSWLISGYLWRLCKGLKAAVPLVLLGGVRQLATAAVGYQQHLGEYGLHWNFYWTIAAVSVATLAVPVPPGWLALAGLLVTLLHQAVLSLNLGLTAGGTLSEFVPAVISEQQRAAAGFWVANKEGLASLPGYWALYLSGAAAGRYLATSCAAAVARARSRLLPHGVGGSSSSRMLFGGGSVSECAREIWAWVGWCLLLNLCVWGLLLAAETWVEPVSRRSCNLAYVLWTTAQCLAWLLLSLITDMLTTGLSGSSSSAPSTLLSSRMKQTPPAAAGPTAAAGGGGGGTAAAGGVGGIFSHASAATGQPTAAALRSRGGRRRSSGSTPAAVAAAIGAAAAAATGSADQVAAAAPVQQCISAPDSPVAAHRHHGAAAAAAAAAMNPPAAAVHGAAAAAAVQGSPDGSISSGASSSPERQRRHIPKQPPQHIPNPINAAGKPLQESTGSTSSGPMRLMLAFNRNMLSLFLLANLLTGVVNLGMDTLAVSNWNARIIVGVYMLVLCGAAVLLDAGGVTLKAW